MDKRAAKTRGHRALELLDKVDLVRLVQRARILRAGEAPPRPRRLRGRCASPRTGPLPPQRSTRSKRPGGSRGGTWCLCRRAPRRARGCRRLFWPSFCCFDSCRKAAQVFFVFCPCLTHLADGTRRISCVSQGGEKRERERVVEKKPGSVFSICWRSVVKSDKANGFSFFLFFFWTLFAPPQRGDSFSFSSLQTRQKLVLNGE